MKILKSKNYKHFYKFFKLSLVFILTLIFYSPVSAEPCKSLNPDLPVGCVRAAGTNNTNNTPAGTNNTNNTPAGTNNTGVKIDSGIKNPIPGIGTIPDFIQSILQFVLYIAVPLIVLAIIYSGFLFVMAAGNTEKLGKAKKTLLYTIIGAALLLGSFVIAGAIKGTVEEISK